MSFVVVSVADVNRIHEYVIDQKELQGLAKDKSLEAVLQRIHNRLQYGFIHDVFDLAACYATFVAKGRCFHDANKRTAAALLFFILIVNGVEPKFLDVSLGEWIIDVATDKKSEINFADWLRQQVS